jgi:hypothetical protein
MIRKTMRTSLFPLLLGLAGLSIAAAPSRFDGGLEQARLQGAFDLQGELFHVQGLALEARRIWVTSVDEKRRRGYLHEFDRRTGKLLRRIDLTDGPRYHPGGISIAGRSIWVPVAEYRANSSAILVEVDADSLQIRRTIPVADHLGYVAASGRHLVAGNWDSRLIHILDAKTGERVRTVQNPSATRYQDMKFVGGQLVAGGSLTLWSGAVDWIDWPSMKVTRTLRAGAIGPIRPVGRGGPYTGEGMAIEGRDLYVVPEDGPSRMFHFRLEDRGDKRTA